jgi:putative spermidine/putrescine transport system substrate-binding protein
MPENSVFPADMSRRTLLGGLLAGAAAVPLLAACGAPATSSSASAGATPAALAQAPAKPVTLNILDVAGNLQLTQPIIEAFKQKYPHIVSGITTTTGTDPADPELRFAGGRMAAS